MQINTRHIRQGGQNPFGFMHKSKGRLTTQATTQETTQEKLSKSAEGILKLIEQNPKTTRKQLADKLNDISEDGVKYHLDKLKKMGYIKRKGSTKSGSWVIIKHINK